MGLGFSLTLMCCKVSTSVGDWYKVSSLCTLMSWFVFIKFFLRTTILQSISVLKIQITAITSHEKVLFFFSLIGWEGPTRCRRKPRSIWNVLWRLKRQWQGNVDVRNKGKIRIEREVWVLHWVKSPFTCSYTGSKLLKVYSHNSLTSSNMNFMDSVESTVDKVLVFIRL